MCVLLAAAGCGHDGEPLPHFPPVAGGPTLQDASGRSLILHGLNVSSSAKDDPLAVPWVAPADLERMRRDWGLNAVRWLIFWEAIEPQPGVFDEEYLERVAERLDWCAAAGLWVVLDMHQDVYGKFSADGKRLGFDGAPAWAARTDGLPHSLVEPWALAYFQPAVRRAFDRFWSEDGPHADLQEHYRQAWQFVARRFAGHPAVIGYDLINEPFAGSNAAGTVGPLQIGDPVKSRQFEETQLTRFYQRLIDAVRAVDADTWILYEPLAFPANNGGPVFLGRLADPRAGETRLAYAPHFYAILPEVNQIYDPTTAGEMRTWEQERQNDSARFGHPVVVGEVGLPWTAGGNPIGYLSQFFDVADRLLASWFYWSYDPGSWGPVHTPGGEETPLVHALIRPYPRAVAGTLLRVAFDRPLRRFTVEYVAHNGGSESEIFVPARRLYPQGFVVRGCEEACAASWDADREVLVVRSQANGGLVRIEVFPPG